LAAGAYKWSARAGLFFASEPAQVTSARKLTLILHKLYAEGPAPAAADGVSVTVSGEPTPCADWSEATLSCRAAAAEEQTFALVGTWRSACLPVASVKGIAAVRRTLEFRADGRFIATEARFSDADCVTDAGTGLSRDGRYAAGAASADGGRLLTLDKDVMNAHLDGASPRTLRLTPSSQYSASATAKATAASYTEAAPAASVE
jgi:hypothetical protein